MSKLLSVLESPVYIKFFTRLTSKLTDRQTPSRMHTHRGKILFLD